ncbi:bifunctional 4-hydroxy-2-oxoglutarate aldolase/2-dehydro-3-deoxy-phosphogluconate aldolase [Streptomyces sp. TRM S81-3]|uniref:Bifunctional 4-hydroxy-2-oxoglutarate aldolase/2-dehydro-3-deoxy-phosphogluconate aldolase n=1 Tax=Streptomyces griseicoloratus TaxID=2752516 RepID=A0A926LAL8_9ACTN|nr:bifunctional 4-hydroxy-2-oxoglutarate aldolase/2-dehydro-3-deoxy-phosphogluconate aldolase [Streptomyces griseicoloratus]MBD0424084.1 bifunctional 4-hydroxy-2-oxoglutarate aldolase/2-dehydro-3-deoxy-phosphogluconate aldolase [Streptomyces griseicoloratus]
MLNHSDFTHELHRNRLVAIVRGSDAKAALAGVLALAQEGVRLIEISLTTPDAETVITRAVEEAGADAVIGAGTVVTRQDALRARDAGAQWMVTPALDEGFEHAVALGVPVLAGALTPTEAVRAMRSGAGAVKLFPASLGGPGYLRALRDPLPDIPFVPVGGVDAEAARAYFAAGAVAVGVGSPLLGDAAQGGDLAQLRVRAREFLAVCAAGASA